MSDRKDEVIEALMVPSRNCTICRTVVSAIHGGMPIDRALVSGLLAASSVIREQHGMLVDRAKNGRSVSMVISPNDDIYEKAKAILGEQESRKG